MILASILGWAVVTLSTSFMRQSPDYESPLENQVLMGALVETFETERYWVKVRAEDYTGWVTDMGLVPLDEAARDVYLEAPKWICVTDRTHIYGEPSAKSQPLSDFSMGNLVRQTGRGSGCTCSCGRGWVEVMLPDGRTGWVKRNCVEPFGEYMRSRELTADSLLALASRFLGTPYMWGGNSAGTFDCSGLVKLCFLMHGVLLPRNASQQAKCGESVPQGQWQPGDLLFFGKSNPLRVSHVAIYMGEGRIIHASQLVRINSLSEYGREVVAARRIIGSGGLQTVLDSPYYFKQDGGEK